MFNNRDRSIKAISIKKKNYLGGVRVDSLKIPAKWHFTPPILPVF